MVNFLRVVLRYMYCVAIIFGRSIISTAETDYRAKQAFIATTASFYRAKPRGE